PGAGAAAADDRAGPRCQGTERRRSAFGPPLPVVASNRLSAFPVRQKVAGTRMKLRQRFGDPGLELDAADKPALERGRGRQRLAWTDGVPLGADGALLGDVAALQWYGRDVVAGNHEPIVRSGS